MGLFDRRREAPKQAAPEPAPQPKPKPLPAAKPAQAAPRQEAPVKPKVVTPEFGIQKAIELMRNLPSDNVPLVVQVVRTTLESTNIDVPAIIGDAKAKRSRISDRIKNLKGEIAEFEEEIAARREEIKALEADGAETKMVQERFEMAMTPDPAPAKTSSAGKSTSGSVGAPRKAGAAKPTSVKVPIQPS